MSCVNSFLDSVECIICLLKQWRTPCKNITHRFHIHFSRYQKHLSVSCSRTKAIFVLLHFPCERSPLSWIKKVIYCLWAIPIKARGMLDSFPDRFAQTFWTMPAWAYPSHHEREQTDNMARRTNGQNRIKMQYILRRWSSRPNFVIGSGTFLWIRLRTDHFFFEKQRNCSDTQVSSSPLTRSFRLKS